MPRLNNGLEILKGISKIELFSLATGTIGDTVTTEQLAQNAADVDVSAMTNFTAADPVFIIGDGGLELNAIGTPATTPMPLKYKAALPQSTGARLVEAVGRNIGHVTEAGVQYAANLALTPINASTSITPLAYQRGQGELRANWALRGFNNLNWQIIHGQEEGEGGAGTAADPHQVVVSGQTLGTHGLLCARIHGYRFDGKLVMQDYLNCTIEVQATVNLGGTTPAELPMAVRFDAMVQRIWGL